MLVTCQRLKKCKHPFGYVLLTAFFVIVLSFSTLEGFGGASDASWLLVENVNDSSAIVSHNVTSYLLNNSQAETSTLAPPSELHPLTDLCRNKIKWRRNLFLNCTNRFPMPISQGIAKSNGTVAMPVGLANLRSVVTTCLRWAIDGGMGFVVPRIALRSETNPIIFDRFGELDFLYDVAHLKKTMHTYCPELEIRESTEIVKNSAASLSSSSSSTFPTPGINYIYSPRRFKKIHGHSHGQFRQRMDDLLVKANCDVNSSLETPTVVWDNEAFLGWRFAEDNSSISKVVHDAVVPTGKLLSLANDIKQLIRQRKQQGFVGLHLRAEKDYPLDVAAQMNAFYQIYRKKYHYIGTLYVAVGDLAKEAEFRLHLEAVTKQKTIDVVSKWSLASSVNKTSSLFHRLSELKFDQLAAVDHEVLVASEYFFGHASSSFTYSIAYDRGNGSISFEASKTHMYKRPNAFFRCCF